MTTRLIHRAAARPHRLISEALQALIVGELMAPGRRLMLVSPWISDVPIVDNRGDQFGSLDMRWGAQWIPLSAVLRTLLDQQMRVLVACGPGAREDAFIGRIRRAAQRDGTEDGLVIRRLGGGYDHALDHEKALVADRWAVHGSMNLTYRGVELNGELVTITTNLEHVASIATELLGLFT